MNIREINIELIPSLIEQRGINFIGEAVTPWHAHGIDSAIKFLKTKGLVVNGLILIKPALKEGKIHYIISEQNFVNNCCEYVQLAPIFNTNLWFLLKQQVLRILATSRYNHQEFNNKQLVYIASPWHLDLNLYVTLHKYLHNTHTFRLMMVEEGLSTYFPAVKTFKHIWKVNATRKHGSRLLTSFLWQSSDKIIQQRFERNTEWINLNLLSGELNNLQENVLATPDFITFCAAT